MCACVCVCVCMWVRRGGSTLAESLPLSIPLCQIYLSTQLILLHLFLVGGLSPWRTAPVLWHTHTHAHTSAMCHYPFHLPLPVIPCLLLHLPTLVLFPPLLFICCFFFSYPPSLSSTPPTLCVTTAGKTERWSSRQKWEEEEENRVKSRTAEERESCVWSATMPPFTISWTIRWWNTLHGWEQKEGGEEKGKEEKVEEEDLKKKTRTKKARRAALTSRAYGDTTQKE